MTQSISFSETPYPRYHTEVQDSTREEARGCGGESKKKAIKNASGSFDRDGKLYNVSRAVQCGTLGPCSEMCSEPFQYVPETVELAASSRSFATFAHPSAVSALACEERHDDSVCGDVFVCGQSGVSVTEGGTGDTLFLNGQDGHGPDTDKQVSLCLHLTATGGIYDPIPEERSCACVSCACVRADSSGDSNSVLMGSIVTEYSAVTKQMVAKNGSRTKIVSSNERYKGESEGDSFIISNGVDVDVDDEYVNLYLRKRACVSGSTGDEVINLKRRKHLTDRTGHGGLTEEVDVLPCDDLSVNRKDTQLIVTDFTETAVRNGTILKGCRAGQNSGCVHSEENIGKYECRDESLSSPNVLPCTIVKPFSFLTLNVCGILSKMKHPDFLSLISNHDIIAISESKLDDTDAVDVPGYVAFYNNRGKFRRKSGGVLLLIKEELAQYVTVFESKDKKPKIYTRVKKTLLFYKW